MGFFLVARERDASLAPAALGVKIRSMSEPDDGGRAIFRTVAVAVAGLLFSHAARPSTTPSDREWRILRTRARPHRRLLIIGIDPRA
jgi:hypothetical protein